MKPNSTPVQLAVDVLDVTPAWCVLIGDSVTDIEAAHSAGVCAIGYYFGVPTVWSRVAADAAAARALSRARVLVSGSAPLPHDGETVGELQVRGPPLFSGY